MDRFGDVAGLRRAFDEGQAIEDVFERFPEETPAEVMKLADVEDESSGSVDSAAFEAFLEDFSPARPAETAGESTSDGEPFDVTADELFGD
ncbi:MAG TPA: hypothetical protein VJ898_14105 [Natrialbaceae archaeon]|nr:hypothetical protein [Natrialbaceae archaeon]